MTTAACFPILAAAALLGCAAMAPAARADEIVNGTFTDSGSGMSSLAGWTATGAVDAAAETDYQNCCGGINAGPNNLAQFGAGQGSGGVLAQSFATVVGQTYSLSFLYGAFGDASSEPQTLGLSVGSLVTSVTDDVDSVDFATLFTQETFTFTATAAETTLTFTDLSVLGSSADGLLENVAVDAIPEPASLGMLGLGALALVAARRRRV